MEEKQIEIKKEKEKEMKDAKKKRKTLKHVNKLRRYLEFHREARMSQMNNHQRPRCAMT